MKNGHKEALVLGLLTLLVASMPLSYLVGSYWHFFSWSSVLVPLAGLYGGLGSTILLFIVRCGLRSLLSSASIVLLFTNTIPGLVASVYWYQSKAIRTLIPVVCMVAFVVHPVGSLVAWYALLWLIPVFVQYFNRKLLFADALAATFTAHAVGSIIWLYTVPMTAAHYVTLVPLVIAERLLFATGITLGVYLINYLSARFIYTAERLTSADRAVA